MAAAGVGARVSSGIRALHAFRETPLFRRVRSWWRLVWWWLGWVGRYWRATAAAVLVGLLAWWRDAASVALLAVGLLLVVSVSATAWCARWPGSYERVCAGPSRRLGWRRWARRSWPHLARECGLSVQRPRTRHRLVSAGDGKGLTSQRVDEPMWVHPRLVKVTASGVAVRLVIGTRTGQTVDDLERVVPALVAASGAVSSRARLVSTSQLEVTLVMREVLANVLPAVTPTAVQVESVPMGLRQDGTPWRLTLMGRHTLVVGCSGSGKGSVLWGVCAGLAPAVSAGLVQVWGVDLKKGVEIGMGRPLFHATATPAEDALPVLRRLLAVIDARGHAMAGVTRLHEPTTADPLHVLVIDELADLIACSEGEVKKEANRLLAVILTQGRALGVVVVACVQDPRKETVGMRSLFTQTVALRLRTASETVMVLGDGMAPLAPAHRVDPTAKGVAYVVDDDGTVDRVRAAYWPDHLIRTTARRHPEPHPESASKPEPAATPQDAPAAPQDAPASPWDAPPAASESTSREGAEPSSSAGAGRKPRAPRKPRTPRAPRASRAPRQGTPS